MRLRLHPPAGSLTMQKAYQKLLLELFLDTHDLFSHLGGVAEWTKAPVSKTGRALTGSRGFKSHPLRTLLDKKTAALSEHRRADSSQTDDARDSKTCNEAPSQALREDLTISKVNLLLSRSVSTSFTLTRSPRSYFLPLGRIFSLGTMPSTK